ncbi:hypothetical protein [Oceanimonas smirnovii]|uniref:hypothetical protein n=1 Tax=Oceanimonas smirnovii TaxID=264574 RepID=UPI003FD5B140
MAGVWYRAGTIAMTSGSKKVTGTGTSWANAQNGIAKGTALVLASGASVDVYEIDRVESNTVLYLVDNYRGTNATGKTYAIDTTRTDSIPEFARRLAATLSYHQQNLDVLQQLYTSTAASITFTAPDGTEITAIPWKKLEQQAARSLEDMGAGTAAKRNVGTAAGNLMEVGAFGLGARAPLSDAAFSASDFNQFNVPSGRYTTSGVWLHGPFGDSGHTGIVEVLDRIFTNQTVQTFYGQFGSRSKYSRYGDESKNYWDRWRMEYDQGNIIGPVSQSNGMPTGAIIERGSNSNGEYVKYADGTLFCKSVELSIDLSVAGPKNVTVPMPHVSTSPATQFTSPVSLYPGVDNFSDVISSANGSYFNIRFPNIDGLSVVRGFYIAAIGRWY